MRPIWIIRNDTDDGPGFLARFLRYKGLTWRLIRIDRGDPVPVSAEQAGGVVFMGSNASVNDPAGWIEPQLELIREAFRRGTPLLGHCFGAQLISKALGGTITTNPSKEIGWYPVAREEGPAAQEWLGDLPASFEVFHWHWETFSLPAGAVPLLTSSRCARQAFVLGNNLGLQFHAEVTAGMVRRWVRDHPQLLSSGEAGVQSAAQILQGLQARIEALHRVAAAFYDRWLEGVMPRTGP